MTEEDAVATRVQRTWNLGQLWIAGVMALVLSACFLLTRDAKVLEYEVDGHELRLFVTPCTREPEVTEFIETDEAVRVQVVVKGDIAGDCLDTAIVELSEPLGSRKVVDLNSGEPVPPLDR